MRTTIIISEKTKGIMSPIKTYYKQRLPHIQQVGASFFVTFRLHGSIPKSELTRLKEKYEAKINQLRKVEDITRRNSMILNTRKAYFAEYDQVLDTLDQGAKHLKDDHIAKIIKEQLHRFDRDLYDLIAYTIMSNHVHILIDTNIQLDYENEDLILEPTYTPLDKIMKRIKGASARYANIALGKTGQFWDRESYDIFIRHNKMLRNVIKYILNNPIKAKIVTNAKDFKWNYFRDAHLLE